MQLLTHSRMNEFRKCPRCHQFKYELGIRKDRTSQPLRFGSNFHEGLDLLGKGMSIEQVSIDIYDRYSELPDWCVNEGWCDQWMAEAEMCVRLLQGYAWRWTNDNVKVESSEQSFEIPLVNPRTNRSCQNFLLAGKIDKIVYWDGRMAVMEHKTTSDSIDVDSDYWKRLTIDQQVSQYYIGAQELGYPAVSTVVYDVIKKPGIRPKKTTKADKKTWEETGLYCDEGFSEWHDRETPLMYGARLAKEIFDNHEKYFARREIPRMSADITEYKHELWQMQRWIRESQLQDRWPRNSSACLKPYRCEYVDFCFNGIGVSGELPEGFVKVDDLHPELERTNDASDSTPATKSETCASSVA